MDSGCVFESDLKFRLKYLEMDKRETDLKEIVRQFALWERKLGLLISVNLNDLNMFSEHYAKELLTIVFNYKFINANSEQCDSASVDLIDRDNRTAVQVSSTKTSAKIQKTVVSMNLCWFMW